MDFLKQYLSKFTHINDDAFNELSQTISLKHYKKDSIITNMGDTPSQYFVLQRGVVRSYIINKNNKEHIRSLFTPTYIVGALSALIFKKPSKLTYQCITDCDLFVGYFSEFKELTQKHRDLNNLYVKLLENTFFDMENKVYQLSVLNATERYLELKKTIPNIENLIPQYHIASYLNITPVQLSRIRKEIYSK